LFGGLLRGLNGALLRLNGVESGCELRVALLLAIAGLLDHCVLSGQRGGELLGVMARLSPGIRNKSHGDQGCDENNDIESGFHREGMAIRNCIAGGNDRA
jgi:hypothetical protein